jgi:hypothetical protein
MAEKLPVVIDNRGDNTVAHMLRWCAHNSCFMPGRLRVGVGSLHFMNMETRIAAHIGRRGDVSLTCFARKST